MTTNIITIEVQQLGAGDIFRRDDGEIAWTALDDAKTDATGTTLKVQFHPDGGIAFRQWDNPALKLTIEREA